MTEFGYRVLRFIVFGGSVKVKVTFLFSYHLKAKSTEVLKLVDILFIKLL